MFLAQPSYLQPAPLAQALATFKKIPFIDAGHEARASWGVVAENISESEAERLLKILKENKLDGVAKPAGEIKKTPPVKLIRTLPADFPQELSLIAAAGIKTTTTKTTQIKEGPTGTQQIVKVGILLSTGLPIPIGPKKRTVEKKETTSEIYFLVDVITPNAERYRLDIQNFDFSFLKEQKEFSGLTNLKTLLKKLTIQAPNALKNVGTSLIMDGKPLSSLTYESENDLEKEIFWLYNLLA